MAAVDVIAATLRAVRGLAADVQAFLDSLNEVDHQYELLKECAVVAERKLAPFEGMESGDDAEWEVAAAALRRACGDASETLNKVKQRANRMKIRQNPEKSLKEIAGVRTRLEKGASMLAAALDAHFQSAGLRAIKSLDARRFWMNAFPALNEVRWGLLRSAIVRHLQVPDDATSTEGFSRCLCAEKSAFDMSIVDMKSDGLKKDAMVSVYDIDRLVSGMDNLSNVHRRLSHLYTKFLEKRIEDDAKADSSHTWLFKLVMLGESMVGKSSLALRFVKKAFCEYQESTVGAAFLTQSVKLDSGGTVKFEVWDTAGQERYHSLAPMYYRGASVGVVTYDITARPTLLVAESWLKELRRQCKKDCVLALCGNKVDLAAEKRQTTEEEGIAVAAKYGAVFLETSAKTNHNVEKLFRICAQLARELAGDREPSEAGVELVLPDERNKKCC